MRNKIDYLCEEIYSQIKKRVPTITQLEFLDDAGDADDDDGIQYDGIPIFCLFIHDECLNFRLMESDRCDTWHNTEKNDVFIFIDKRIGEEAEIDAFIYFIIPRIMSIIDKIFGIKCTR